MMETEQEMAKKKIVKSDVQYHVIFGSRRQIKIFNQDVLNNIVDANAQYFDMNDIEIFDKDVIDDGSAVYLNIYVPADISLSNVVFNIKRNSFPKLYKQSDIKQKLSGEKALWTRDFVVSVKGKYSAVELYHELLKETNV